MPAPYDASSDMACTLLRSVSKDQIDVTHWQQRKNISGGASGIATCGGQFVDVSSVMDDAVPNRKRLVEPTILHPCRMIDSMTLSPVVQNSFPTLDT